MIFKLESEEYRIVGSDFIRRNIFAIELCGQVRWLKWTPLSRQFFSIFIVRSINMYSNKLSNNI
ncbi:hypothetical protein [Clostridium ljungdahlii]|nr:hypothetical protein [Clostridium ljungdahlii]